MPSDFSRRTMLRGFGVGAATLLLHEWFPATPLFAAGPSDSPHTGSAALELTLTAVSDSTLRVNLVAADVDLDQTFTDNSVVSRSWPQPMVRTQVRQSVPSVSWGKRRLHISTDPLRIIVEDGDGRVQQELRFDSGTSQISFQYGNGPVFGL